MIEVEFDWTYSICAYSAELSLLAINLRLLQFRFQCGSRFQNFAWRSEMRTANHGRNREYTALKLWHVFKNVSEAKWCCVN